MPFPVDRVLTRRQNEKPQLERLQRRPFAKLNGERQSVIELAVGQPLVRGHVLLRYKLLTQAI